MEVNAGERVPIQAVRRDVLVSRLILRSDEAGARKTAQFPNLNDAML
ncbi:hypothetical protein W911_01200 [Hyphomicrobium nitrativorans NL23]|uniref:Uncharacterized protein n=1 Tax=Hyphomicrobium nitrativorans NL23 TaxID=1029756 RepID=V5SH59_9HYPH|nr:hypothetical protein [Hyphomicrobium nitrativorans]AHB49817.1 hypothetical protein W911_01200 [Hyphomicrobium nitrativorans NL23]